MSGTLKHRTLNAPSLRQTPLRREELTAFFASGVKRPADLQIGVEWEKLGVYRDSGQAIRYQGPRGVEGIFRALAARYGWTPVRESGRIIALEKHGSSITLEPGGQIELSGRKAFALRDNAAELREHLAQIRSVSSPLGIAWLGLGVQPFSRLQDIEWVPKERYTIMRSSLRRGALTHHMMKRTASIQISLDYTSEADAVRKLRLGLALAPFLEALLANSPFSEGRTGPFLSKRARIWTRTAPERSGPLEAAFEKGFGFAAYAEHALDVPLIFIVRNDRWLAPKNLTFREFLEKGWKGYHATLADWELHLTTLFTDTRLKTYIEIRSVDCQGTEVGLGVPALIKGLFYDETAFARAWSIAGALTTAQRRRLTAGVREKGLRAAFRGGTVLDAARELVKAAGEGLWRLAAGNVKLKEDPAFLRPIEALAREGRCPAERLLDRFPGPAIDPVELVSAISIA